MVEASGGRCSPKAAGILRARWWGSPAVTREGASGFGQGRDGGGEGRGRGASRNQVQGAGSWRCLEESASLSARSVCSTGSDVATGAAHGLQPSSAPCPWLTTVQAPGLPPFCRPCCPSACVSLSDKEYVGQMYSHLARALSPLILSNAEMPLDSGQHPSGSCTTDTASR